MQSKHPLPRLMHSRHEQVALPQRNGTMDQD
jgi:hypothetical protein